MRRAPPSRKPTFITLADVQKGKHYACHVDQPEGPRYYLDHVADADMDEMQACTAPDQARGIPTSVNYKDGVIRVWPWPAPGWQVWAELAGKEVTPSAPEAAAEFSD